MQKAAQLATAQAKPLARHSLQSAAYQELVTDVLDLASIRAKRRTERNRSEVSQPSQSQTARMSGSQALS